MASSELPPHTSAAQSLGSIREPQVPAGWPGTYVPNLSEWAPGDVILVEAEQNLSGFGIQAVQTVSRRAMGAAPQWSHAGIYVGNGEIVDAVYGAGKVVIQQIWNYCQHRSLLVRRINIPQIPSARIAAIPTIAKSYINAPYSLLQAALGKLGIVSAPNPAALYCSTLVGLVLDQATGLDFTMDPQWRPLYPGTLAVHLWLKDVSVEWRDF